MQSGAMQPGRMRTFMRMSLVSGALCGVALLQFCLPAADAWADEATTVEDAAPAVEAASAPIAASAAESAATESAATEPDTEPATEPDTEPAATAAEPVTASVADTSTSAATDTATEDSSADGPAPAAPETSGYSTVPAEDNVSESVGKDGESAPSAAAETGGIAPAVAETDTGGNSGGPASSPTTGWADTEEGARVYYDQLGKRVTGDVFLGSAWYHFDKETGAMLSNTVLEQGGVTRAYDANGRMVTGLSTLFGATQYFDTSTGELQTSTMVEDDAGDVRYFDSDGEQVTGTVELNGATRYFNPAEDGVMAASGLVSVQGTTRGYDGSGAQITGVGTIGTERYLFDRSGALLKSGLTAWRGNSYYLDPATGAMQTGAVDVNGTLLYFDENTGARSRGGFVAMRNGNEYLVNPDGTLYRGNFEADNGWVLHYDGATGLRDIRYEVIYNSSDWDMTWNAQFYGSDTDNLIIVDTGSNVVGIYQRFGDYWQMIRYMDCTDGAWSTPTIHGEFKLGIKGYYFDSWQYRCFYYSQISGDYLFHSILYAQTDSPRYVLDGTMGASASHGCVRLYLDDAYFIYSSIPSGSTVVVY